MFCFMNMGEEKCYDCSINLSCSILSLIFSITLWMLNQCYGASYAWTIASLCDQIWYHVVFLRQHSASLTKGTLAYWETGSRSCAIIFWCRALLMAAFCSYWLSGAKNVASFSLSSYHIITSTCSLCSIQNAKWWHDLSNSWENSVARCDRSFGCSSRTVLEKIMPIGDP